VLVMPQQGNTVESCLIVGWRAAEGQPVRAGEVVCEVETDKAMFEVSAGADGVLLKILRQAGDDVPVMAPIAVIGAHGEDWTNAVPGSDRPGTGPAAVREGGPAPAASAMPPPNEVRGRGGPGPAMRPLSPRARRLAAEKGISVAGLVGTGPGGRVIERDVVAARAAPPAPVARGVLAVGGPTPAAARGGPAADGDRAGVPVRGIRKLIGERMRASLSTTAQLTFNGSAPAARILALRARLKASDASLGLSSITIGDLVLYAACRVVPRFPTLNAHLVDGVLRTFERVHLGLAVDTPRGLMVPVIRNADQLSLIQLSAEAKRLASACLDGTVQPDELAGATFTVTNLGSFGVESFTPVLNAPQVGILGVCAITPRVAAGPDGAPAVEQRMGLSLTVDHQIIDGAPASRILQAFADAIADVDLLLVK
jgi:pyruvate dehydrogenase E2 component (dihydrolipoamide acetyltransferase)